MYTTLFIIGMWIVAMGGMYALSGAMFWVFAQLFGRIDSYMQDRYWKKRGYTKITREDGQEWYVGYGD